MNWTTDRVEKLKKLWAEELSASQVALRLGGFGDCADGGRNAVISKIHRMGLPKRATTQRALSAQAGTRKNKANKAKRMAAQAAKLGKPVSELAAATRPEPFVSKALDVPVVERKTLADLEPGDCRFPFGDGPYLFCGRKKMIGVSYCRDHLEVCTTAPQVKGQRAANRVPVAAGWETAQVGGMSSQNDSVPASGPNLKDLEIV